MSRDTTPHLVSHDDVASFLAAAQAALERHEAEHSLMLGSALSMLAGRRAPEAPLYFATIHEGGALSAAAFMTPPFPLLVAPVRDGGDAGDDVAPAALELVARDLHERGGRPTGVHALPALAERFVELWCRTSGTRARLATRQRLHVLTAVRPVPAPPGGMRVATADDLDVIPGWMAAFEAEAMGDDAADRARAVAERRIESGQVHVWDDGEPRAMASWARPTAHGISINAVYTPPTLRGRGYATALVAALSHKLLAEGRSFCALFTDLANPTSNAIYARVGYRPLRDFAHYRFEGA